MTKPSLPKSRSSRPGPKGPKLEPAVPKDAERIAKVIARAGVASRREAEALVLSGRVLVNGEVISSPALNVTAKDRISVNGSPLPQRERTRLFLFHKPRGLVTTRVDPQGRPTIFDALPSDLPRLVSVGRLDLNTEGLLLLTNDGGLKRVLELPATGWLRRYRVRAFGNILQPQLDALRKGIEVDGVRYGPIEAALEREQGDNVWLTFAMREGKNREIRNVMRALGLQVNRLIRISYGPFQLGEIPVGGVEEIRTKMLRDQLGERLAAAANTDFSAPITERVTEREPAPVASSPRRPDGRPHQRSKERPKIGAATKSDDASRSRPRGTADRAKQSSRADDRPSGRSFRSAGRPQQAERTGDQPRRADGRPHQKSKERFKTGAAIKSDDAPRSRPPRDGADRSQQRSSKAEDRPAGRFSRSGAGPNKFGAGPKRDDAARSRPPRAGADRSQQRSSKTEGRPAERSARPDSRPKHKPKAGDQPRHSPRRPHRSKHSGPRPSRPKAR